jgi:DNA-binding CsgD family transcriptional regulator
MSARQHGSVQALTYEERLTLRRLVSERRRELIPADSLYMDSELQRRVERICEQEPKPKPATRRGRDRCPKCGRPLVGRRACDGCGWDERPESLVPKSAEAISGRAVEAEYLAAALAAAADVVGLTLRETQVLGCVASGLNTEETGARLGVSAGTVKMHFHNVFAKLGARDRTHAVAIVLSRFGRSAIEPSRDADVA